MYLPKKRNENILITIAFQGASPWPRNARSGSTSAGLVVKLRSSPANSSTSWEVIGWCKWHEKHRIYRSNLYIYIYIKHNAHTKHFVQIMCWNIYYDHIMYNLWHSKKHVVIQPYWKPYDIHHMNQQYLSFLYGNTYELGMWIFSLLFDRLNARNFKSLSLDGFTGKGSRSTVAACSFSVHSLGVGRSCGICPNDRWNHTASLWRKSDGPHWHQ